MTADYADLTDCTDIINKVGALLVSSALKPQNI